MPKATPLLENHRKHNAKIVEFAGYLMPLQYSGVMDEHATVRTAVGLFDVSHMGEILLSGPGALKAARRLVTNDVEALHNGQVLYSPICYPDGGIVDDCLVYRLADDQALFVVNASNIEKDHAWIAEQTGDRCKVENQSDQYALLALQGPRAAEVLGSIAEVEVAPLPSFSFMRLRVAGVDCLASRTGYTGEDGFEIGCAPSGAPRLWDALMEAGARFGIKPAGLGARDTLRLEARLPLYGNDIDASTTPLEAGLGWTVKLNAGEFIGQAALQRQKAEGLKRRLCCLVMTSRGIARHGHPICLPGPDGGLGQVIGQITSGTTSPTLGKAIALGYLPSEHSRVGSRVLVDVRGKPVEAEVVKGPFYKRATA